MFYRLWQTMKSEIYENAKFPQSTKIDINENKLIHTTKYSNSCGISILVKSYLHRIYILTLKKYIINLFAVFFVSFSNMEEQYLRMFVRKIYLVDVERKSTFNI